MLSFFRSKGANVDFKSDKTYSGDTGNNTSFYMKECKNM